MEKSLISIDGYTIIKRLGTGARTTIYQAKEDATGRTVALKGRFLKVLETPAFLIRWKPNSALPVASNIRISASVTTWFGYVNYCEQTS